MIRVLAAAVLLAVTVAFNALAAPENQSGNSAAALYIQAFSFLVRNYTGSGLPLLGADTSARTRFSIKATRKYAYALKLTPAQK
jgi:hypothetical protein